jgi:hypothetical protein
LLAERERQGRTDARVVRLLRGDRVDQQAEHRILRAVAQQGREHAGRVAVAARARIVLRVGEHHGQARRAARHGALHGVVGRQELGREVALGVADQAGQALDRVDGLLARRTVAEHARPALGEIRHREGGREGEHDAAVALEPRELAVEPLRRLDQGAGGGQRDEELELAERARRPVAGAQDALEQARGARTGIRHVDMRVGAVRDEPVGVLDHGARDIGMKIEEATTGTRGPTTARTRRSSSPSPSSTCSATMAPCRSR